ncbi:MAG: hypothetical protein GAK41_01652 [Burkholderia gladioli]|nr:MAG: hypothetical protein GAK41_01652 [Burkholderia gladioli]
MMAGGSAATPKPSATSRTIAATELMQFTRTGRSTARANSRSIAVCGPECREKLMTGCSASRSSAMCSPPRPSDGLATQRIGNSHSGALTNSRSASVSV